MSEKYSFLMTCVHASDGEEIRDMCENARQISYKTMKKRCDETLKEVIENLGYDRDLRIEKDFTVSFWKSKFQGKPCYYFDWSRIEHIFVVQTEKEKENGSSLRYRQLDQGSRKIRHTS